MSYLYISRPYTDEEKRGAIKIVLQHAVPDRDFYLLVCGAVLLALSGIFADSIAVLIASMIVAPLAYPILGIALGLVVADFRLVARACVMLGLSLVIAVGLAAIVTYFFGHIRLQPQFISFESNLTIATFIALISGFIAAYGLVRMKVGSAMTGIGIAVSLMPPLVATGISIVDPSSFSVSLTFHIFLLNVGGILIGSMAIFFFMGFSKLYSSSRTK